MNIREKAAELEKYAVLEGTELGELCQALIATSHYTDYMSDKFKKALEKEIDGQLKNFKEHSRIVETEAPVQRKQVELEWDDR